MCAVAVKLSGARDCANVAPKESKMDSFRSFKRIFDITTIEGLKQAERFKARLENKYDKVITTPIGLTRVLIRAARREEKR